MKKILCLVAMALLCIASVGCQKAEVAGTLVVTVPEDYHEESGAIVYVSCRHGA